MPDDSEPNAPGYIDFPTMCRGCSSYFNRHLADCPACGAHRGSSLDRFWRPEARLTPDLPTTPAAFRDWFAARGSAMAGEAWLEAVEDIVRDAVAEGQVWSADAYRAELLPYCALAEVIPGFVVASAPPLLDPILVKLTKAADGLTSRIKFRCLGGLPVQPSGVDVAIRVSRDAMRVTETRSGRLLAQIAPHRLLCATTSFVQDDAVSPWRFGALVGPLVACPRMTTRGGGASFYWANGGTIGCCAIGNRSGWLDKGQPEYYKGMVDIIGAWADTATQLQESSRGSADVALELGLGRREATEPAPSPDDVTAGMYLGFLANVGKPIDVAVMAELPKAIAADARARWAVWALPNIEHAAAVIRATPAPDEVFNGIRASYVESLDDYANAAKWWLTGDRVNGDQWARLGAAAREKAIDIAERAPSAQPAQ